MKLCHCAFGFLIIIICMWLFSYAIIKIDGLYQKTSIEVNIVHSNNEEIVIQNISNPNASIKRKIKHHVPKIMLDLYENSKNLKNNNLSIIFPDVVRSVIPSYEDSLYPNVSPKDINNNHYMLMFNLPNSKTGEIFIGAELRVLTLIEVKSEFAEGIERQLKISLFNETTKEFNLLEEKHIYHTNNTWVAFNVSNAVKFILSNNVEAKSLKLAITIKVYEELLDHNTGSFKLSLIPELEDFEHDYPILLLFYANTKKDSLVTKEIVIKPNESHFTRNKRSLEDDYEEENNKLWDDDAVNKAVVRRIKRLRNNCKRKSLYIDFAEIQYDTWIVQPTGYEAYQCTGKCFYPVADHLSPTKHAIIQALLHSISPTRVPRSCCVPTKLDSISILYVDSQGVLTYRYAYKDMVVSECGCR